MLLTLALVAHVLMPPAVYDHEPVVPYTVIDVPSEVLNGLCQHPGHLVVGCTWGDRVFVDPELDAASRDQVLRHEKAHLNGWHHEGE